MCEARFVSVCLMLLLMLPALPGVARAETASASADSNAIAIQKARAERVKLRAEKAHYTKRWNLEALPEYVPESRLSGTLRIAGSNYYSDGKLDELIEDGFRSHHPDVRFEYRTPTALVAIPALYFGLADIAVSRRITFDDSQAFMRVKGHLPLQLTVATGSYDVPGWNPALGIFVHKDNPLGKLTLQQLDAIFGAERSGGFDTVEGWVWRADRARPRERNIRHWGELGLTGEWADKPINIYGLTLKYHQQLIIERVAMDGGGKWNERLREYSHTTRPDGTTLTSNAALLADLSADRYGIAYSNMGYVKPEHRVHGVALAHTEAGPYVAMNLESVRDRSYPLIDELHVYIDREPGQPIAPAVREFARYLLSREGQAAVMQDGKWLPLTVDIVEEQRKLLDKEISE